VKSSLNMLEGCQKKVMSNTGMYMLFSTDQFCGPANWRNQES
jgi:hypothetical protein